ncbi:hypothetical protein A2533_00895 [Candidatus Falkowbacteria bacterium RIFOXYD2_FULL_35_9]|uniref:Uncharacterized protein n=1 Tax=Candidatus Falkowbacteria bacterium RIFOXYC2_FULL_36_12 TaxID=1798002 RepID=A0A1F5T070_9BACT|nr:MAG: hypothetical protein A2478_05255 [Candidatus Falkowbacteria bacterium RIFOXYC2_FULL_36_12]OGF45834.1 MAG: hypothetical protein A2533_00895 [Candidatus Falkowbacteria bacterium RIFOXYD2_FULL_35_9]
MNFRFVDGLNITSTPPNPLDSKRVKIDQYNAPQLGTTKEEIIGNISDVLPKDASVIIVTDANFRLAEDRAKALGYRPAKAGEFLQILEWFRTEPAVERLGWFYCYAGRQPGYAVVAQFHGGDREVIFDTRVRDLADMSSANMDTKCFFVRD